MVQLADAGLVTRAGSAPSAIANMRRRLREFRCTVWRLRGEDFHGEVLDLRIAGDRLCRNYLCGLFFRSVVRSRTSRSWLWQELLRQRLARRPAVSVVCAPLPNGYGASAAGVFIPRWVGGSQDLAQTAELMQQRPGLRGDIRRIKRNGLSYRISHDLSDLKHFYDAMYLPYLRRTHGDSAYVNSYDLILNRFRSGELLLVLHDGRPVAGGTLYYKEGQAYAGSLGVLHGQRDYVKLGALNALFYFEAKHVKAEGFTSLHQGASRPFLADGVLQYKRKWGFRIEDRHRQGFLLSVRRLTPAVRRFLRDNPFLHVDAQSGAMAGAVFVDDADALTATQLAKLRNQFLVPGLRALGVYALDRRPSPATSEAVRAVDDNLFTAPVSQLFPELAG